jgi:RNA polymerase sigma-70 factor (ECF subfamily)
MPTSATPTHPSAPLDIETLYRSFSSRLRQVVAGDVRAPEVVIEDACHFAWDRLLIHLPEFEGGSPTNWLIRTAVREARRQERRRRREQPLEEEEVDAVVAQLPAPGPDLQERAEQTAQLSSIRRLPARQQRVLWLQALGLSYAEIAQISGCSKRTVERQLLRAKRRLRDAEAATGT